MQSITSKSVYVANDELAGFTGTEHWYRHSIFKNKTYTDGVKALADTYECYWLIDDIMIFSGSVRAIRTQPFQVWKLEREMQVSPGTGEVISRKDSFNLTCDDGNGNVLFSYHYHICLYKADRVKLYYENDVLLLPSER